MALPNLQQFDIIGSLIAKRQAEENLRRQQEIAAQQKMLVNVITANNLLSSLNQPSTKPAANIPTATPQPTAQTPTQQQPITQQNTTLGATIPNVQEFTYNWQGETNAAYESLKDFYAKLLDFAGGRLDLAKRMLEYTYQQGMRESTQEYEQTAGELARQIPVETANLIAALNRRGVIQSGFGAEESKRLSEGQLAREQAVERAKENRESRLLSEKNFNLEQEQKSYAEKQFDLERQRRQEAQQMAQQKYGIKTAEYNAELDKQAQAEARRIQGVANNATGQIAGASTYGGAAATSKPPEPTSPTVKVGGATGKVADSTGKLYGGWYLNPSTGKTQRYWGSGFWTDN